MNRNNDFIFDAVSKIESLTSTSFKLDDKHEEYDAVLTVNDKKFNVIAKSTIRDSNIGILLAPFVNQPEKQNASILFIAKYISKSSTGFLKDNNLNYLDASGNTYIKKDGLFIFIEGQKTDRYDKEQTRAFQEAGLKLILLLLSKPESLDYSYRELSEKTGVSLGSVSNILTELETFKFILKTKQKRVIKNKAELIERWVVAYNEILKPRIVRKRMKLIQPPDFKEIQNFVYADSSVWGGEPAAAVITNNLRPEQYTLYSNQEMTTLSKQFKLIPNPDGNFLVCELFWKFKNEAVTAPSLVVYADLMSSGFERNIEMAKIILDNEL